MENQIHAMLIAVASMIGNADTATLVKVVGIIRDNPADDDWAEHLAVNLLGMEATARDDLGDSEDRGDLLAALATIE
jgi:hypothetical protein